MASDEKPESDWEEAERVGPYQLHEPISDSASDRGELFRATNPSTGATALVLKLDAREGAQPVPDLQVRFMSSSDHNCLSMEVDSSPWSFSNDKQSAEELVCAFEGMRDGLKQMDEHLSGPREPVPQRRSMRVWAGAAIACLLVFFCLQVIRSSPRYAPSSRGDSSPAQEQSTNTMPPWIGSSLVDELDGGTVTLSRPLPAQPYEGQKRPPCKARVEVEIMGACWVPHELKAPCPEELHEYQGRCFTASMRSTPLPRSLGQ